MIITPGIIVNEKERVINKVYPSFPTPKKYVYGICTFFQQGIFFKSDLFKKTNGFNVSNKTNWDGELFLDLLATNHPHYPSSVTLTMVIPLRATTL
mgnify:CR=1 FL=1